MKINIFIILFVLTLSTQVSAQDKMPPAVRSSFGFQYNGVPVNTNIRLLESTIDITPILTANHMTLEDVRFWDLNVAAVKFLVRDNLKEVVDQKPGRFSFDMGLSLARMFERTLIDSTNVQSIRGVSPYALEVTGMYKLGTQSYLTVKIEYGRSAYAFASGSLTPKEFDAKSYLMDISHTPENSYDSKLINHDVDATLQQTFADMPTFCNQHGCTLVRTNLVDHQRVNMMSLSCGAEIQDYTLRFQYEDLFVKRVEDSFRMVKTDPENPTVLNSAMILDSNRRQQTFGFTIDKKVAKMRTADVCLSAGYSYVLGTSRYETHSANGAYTDEGGFLDYSFNAIDTAPLKDIYDTATHRMNEAIGDEYANVFTLGLVVKLKQRNNRIDIRKAKLEAREDQWNKDENRRLQDAEDALSRAIKRSNDLMDKAEMDLPFLNTDEEKQAQISRVQKNVYWYLENFDGYEDLEEDFINYATRAVYDRASKLGKRQVEE